MTIASAFAPIDAYNNRAVVEAQTFGHLAPQPRVKHKISILFCDSEYCYQIPIKVESDDLPDSPWFYEDMQDMINEAETKSGKVYRFTGTYEKFKNGRCRWLGKTELII